MNKITSLVLAVLVVLGFSPPATASEPLQVRVYAAEGLSDSWGVRRAIRQWNAAGVVELRRTSDRAAADIVVRAVRPSRLRFDGRPPLLGVAIRVFNRADPSIDYCKILLNRTLDRAYRPQVTIHEMGHCLGLDHNNMVSIMNDNMMTKSVTAFDLTSLLVLYATR